MKFVKCSEHLPGYVKNLHNVSHKHIIRRIDNKAVIPEYFNLYGNEWGLENFEWIDEESPSPELEAEREKAKMLVDALELAEVEIKSMYNRMGFKGSNILSMIKAALNNYKNK